MFYSSELLKVSDLLLSLQTALRAVVYRKTGQSHCLHLPVGGCSSVCQTVATSQHARLWSSSFWWTIIHPSWIWMEITPLEQIIVWVYCGVSEHCLIGSQWIDSRFVVLYHLQVCFSCQLAYLQGCALQLALCGGVCGGVYLCVCVCVRRASNHSSCCHRRRNVTREQWWDRLPNPPFTCATDPG